MLSDIQATPPPFHWQRLQGDAQVDEAICESSEQRESPLIVLAQHTACQSSRQQVRIPTPGTNVSRALFGALNIRTGRWVSQVHELRRMRPRNILLLIL